MTGGEEVTPIAGEGQVIFIATVQTFYTGKAVVQIAAIEITLNHLLNVRPLEAVLLGKIIIIDLNEGLKN